MDRCEQCIVRQFSALNALTKDELMQMTVCRTSESVKKGQVLFTEGEFLKGVYCIKNGICKLTKLSANGREQIVKLITRGDLLGQRSIMSNEKVNLSAIAVTDMEICLLPREEILRSMETNREFSSEMIRDVCHDLKNANNSTVNMAQKTVKQRLADTLLYLYRTFGVDEHGFLRAQLTREELAGLVGTATESLIRMLSGFTRDGLIQTEGKKIKPATVPGLEKISNGQEGITS
ncbi:cAMP-binding domain of CRP or a regulatory subunit of cAMP-dependent protein kinases [Sinomicrobium oceani]|uniref:cAMP-binding domain of CRP or a regulatory subunit of cAMP-dependent protein kinases n=1 Tax=Sinomicrobium oceani TaxID=1150368 RepID=A0A1K1MD71_9FLAO|nr:Crp/Fnr family transcriptional regulator [Sinomicrobium oceani]SFW21092.1 cAMP-binding domain of CRP or a regulatory subunit of cAMP-dependent protein kinases [Sinomicrobium oceani]